MNTNDKSTWLLALSFVLLWNSGFIGADYALPYANPFTLLFWRYWTLAALLLGYLLMRRQFRWPGWGAVGTAMFIGVLAHGTWLGCVLFSLLYGVPPGIVAMVVALQPMVTGALSGRVVGEPTPLLRWLGLFVGFAGVLIAVVPRTDFSDSESVFAYTIPFGSVLAITIASLIQRRLSFHHRPYRLPVDLSLFYQSVGTALAVSLPAIAFEGLATHWTSEFVATMLWLIIGVSLGAYGLMWLLIQRVDATRVASLFYLGPPVTMVMAWLAFGDVLTGADLAALVVIGAGVWLTQVSARTHR